MPLLKDLRDRLLGVRTTRYSLKEAEIPFTTNYLSPNWGPVSWSSTSWDNLVNLGYQKNAAVFQCVSALAFGYPEPPPVVKRKDEPQPNHQLQRLLDRPNPLMSHSELMLYSMVYRAVGASCYLHKVRNGSGGVVELWPYHAGQMWPIQSRYGWVEDYGYYDANRTVQRIPASEIIHLKWPSVDLTNPIEPLSPLRAVAREVDTDNEATRYQYALLLHDAVVHGVVQLPPNTPMSPTKAEELRARFHAMHGGDNRGGIVILEQGAQYQRVGLNIQEMAFDALRRVPESRIAGAFRVPAILAGLYVGLEKATYSNYREARQQLTEDTFVPLWRSDAVELTQALADEFGGDIEVTYDTGKVAALQENEDAKYARVISAYDSGLVMKNEGRLILGLPKVIDVDRSDPDGDVFKDETTSQPEQRPIIDVLPQPALTEQRRYPYPHSFKARRQDRIEDVQARMAAAVEAELRQAYEAAL